MERSIGEIFELNGDHYQVVKSDSDCYCDRCRNCDIGKENSCSPAIITAIAGKCYSEYRRDHNPVYFKLVDMSKEEKRTFEITLDKAREWYKKGSELKEVALQAFSESELKGDSKSHSWRDFCINANDDCPEKKYWYIDLKSEIAALPSDYCILETDRNLYPTKEYAEAALALAQLLQLRYNWRLHYTKKDTDWEDAEFSIYSLDKEIIVSKSNNPRVMSFPTEELANEFLHDFKDLLKKAKLLL